MAVRSSSAAMLAKSSRQSSVSRRWIGRLAMLILVAATGSEASGQARTSVPKPHHYFQNAMMPPGSIGQAQLLRGGPLAGYFQPVEVTLPAGTQVAMAIDGVFDTAQPAPLTVGMLVGQVYRLKVTGIPNHEGEEVFPSIEIVNRLYPPAGTEWRFPVPVQLTREELEMALNGRFVIRVIYIENPRTALPRREDPKHQRYFQVASEQDPLEVADRLGRPVAILRMGSRVPEVDAMTGRFVFQSPPWLRTAVPTAAPTTTSPPTSPLGSPPASVPRAMPTNKSQQPATNRQIGYTTAAPPQPNSAGQTARTPIRNLSRGRTR